MRRHLLLSLALFVCGCLGRKADPNPPKPIGTVQAVKALLERVVPGSSGHFDLALDKGALCRGGLPCYTMETSADGKLKITGTSASELSAAVGYYFRQYCNMTIGWPRGGGSRVFLPKKWPRVSVKVTRQRNTPWSYIMNVCTHSYSLVWYGWREWEAFIDWMALSGINLNLAMTGQEEVQYKVFRQLGLNDTTIRSWFNGPALLTWSRGQNEYGADIAGPLPRSWMRDQWALQRRILARYRSLGIVGELPGFQGNVPVELKDILGDANITRAGATGWMDSLDPEFGRIADIWMKTLIEDFGTDHWYQLDGYFDGGTAPWLTAGGAGLLSADAAGIPDDLMAYKRGAAAYQGLNRTDPDAMWSFQGWAFVGWSNEQKAEFLKGFVDATPPGKFVVIDMSVDGSGEWHKWSDLGEPPLFGANFIWTTLHDFGGTDGMKGNLTRVNSIPFDAMSPAQEGANVWGTGFTPEGIDQNPVYYEFVVEANWRQAPEKDIPTAIVERSHRRYGLAQNNADVDRAWRLLVGSAYSQDVSVQDGTGVPHLPGHSSQFGDDRRTPSKILCDQHTAWGALISAASAVEPDLETFRYDLVNLGREVLAQLSTPASMNYSDALSAKKPDETRLRETGTFYVDLLRDVDTLVGSEPAFLLGPWIAMARALANGTDCDNAWDIDNCADFLEWNARVQLTTWNPTPKDAAKIPGGPIDYASKHWNGLIKDYYAARAALLLDAATDAAKAGKPLADETRDRVEAKLAYEWTTARNAYPAEPKGDAVAISKQMREKYAPWFASC